MSLSSHNWFKYINEMRLNEGVRDIGLPEVIIDRIEETLPDASEKAKTWMGARWKQRRLGSEHLQTEFMVRLLGTLSDAGVLEGSSTVDVEEGDSEKLQQVKFQIQNALQLLKNTKLAKWKRGFQKIFRNLSELGVPSEAVEEIQERVNALLLSTFEVLYSRAPYLFSMLNLDPTYYEEIKDFTEKRHAHRAIPDAEAHSEEVMNAHEVPEQIVLQFDDGSYWYDLQTSSCDIEASRMGHCGGDSRADTLFSLRKKDRRQKESKSYVTLAWSEHEDAIYQIKGRANDVPHEWAWPHIAALVDQLGATVIHENGEHSNDPEEFMSFLEYLGENTNAEVADSAEALWEEMEGTLEEIEQDVGFDSDDGGGIVTGYGYDMADPGHVFDNNVPWYDSWATVNLQIDLGWPDVVREHGTYRSRDFAPIPEDSWGAVGVRTFKEQIGLDDVAGDMPSIGYDSETETDYEVQMLEGLDGAETAHLLVQIQVRSGGDTDTDDYRYFIEQLEQMNEQSNADEINAKVRTALVAGDYAKPTAWDKSKKALLDLEEAGDLKNFLIVDDPVSIDFIFRDPESKQTAIRSELVIPATLLPYMDMGQGSLFHDMGEPAFLLMAMKMFEGTPSPSFRYWIDSPVLNSHMYQQLNYLYRRYQRAQHDPRQEELPFGHQYRRQATSLPQDVQVEMRVKPIHGSTDPAGPHIVFEYTFKIIVGNRSSQEEIDQTIDFLKVLDANPEFVTAAAEEILDVKAGVMLHDAKQRQEKYNDPQHFQNLYAGMDRAWAAEADRGSNYAEAIVLMLMWFRDNYNDMDSVAKLIAIHDYMEPWSLGQMSPRNTTAPRPLAYHEEERNLGKPVGFDQKVRVRTRAMGGHAPEHGLQREGIEQLTRSIRSARMKESPEDRFARLDKLLNERDPTYDLRIYRMTIGCTVNDDVGGSEAETAAEIRGIAGVTTVRPIADKKKYVDPSNEYIPFEIKFELLGPQSRVNYRDQILMPAVRKIKGVKIIDWTSIHRTNIQGTIRTVREGWGEMGNFGGLGGALGAVGGRAYATPPLPTPAPTIEELIADWTEGGVQVYDVPTDTTDMAYHVMMPVKELWPYSSTYYRGDQLSFDGNYQDFIRNGSQAPVFLAIGKNGRAKITGNEDLLWFAKKSGLEEVPVFISYQRQV